MCLEIIRLQTICMLPITYIWIKYTHVSFYYLITKKEMEIPSYDFVHAISSNMLHEK